MGLGLGILLASMVMFTHNSRLVPIEKVEALARQMGMVFPEEIITFGIEDGNNKGGE